MDDSYFAPIDGDDHLARFLAGPATSGPWDERLQHGGPPNALAVDVANRAIRAATGRTDLIAVRFAADFVGPVPVSEVELTATVLRAARSAALVEVTTSAAGRACLSTRVWFVRQADTGELAPALTAPSPVPPASTPLDIAFGYGLSIDWRFVRGRMGVPGPAAAWGRPRIALLPGQPASGLALVALISDTASGISAELDWARWSFPNVDLDVHVARPVEGEWILLEAATHLGPAGSAMVRSTLSDVRGELGAGLQTLVVAPMPGRS